MPNECKTGREPIAIVGSACRFPGDATCPSKLWDLVKEPRDVLSAIPTSRFNAAAFYHPDGSHHGTTNVRHSYLLAQDVSLFDAQFFGTKPIEANAMDPQQRLLLETVYEGLESAGMPMEKLQGSNTGVYVGVMTDDYTGVMANDVQSYPTYFASGTARSILSNRISYFFDWHGPSMTIDTACSASLTAMHQAVQSLRSGESRIAIAAGTNLLLGPEQYIAESKLKMLSPNGRSRMWDKDADGYARGDGIAAVVLKPLSAALADGDHVECIVRETGVNQDGKTKGITMPSPIAQAELIRSTYERAGLDLSKESDRPQYFEAHGTGTPAGDPVEAEAISKAFFGSESNYRKTGSHEPPLYVGSIKTIIGHTEGTAGIAAVLKASLALQNATVPPNLLLNELNPAVKPFYENLQILDTARKWPRQLECAPRRASVNSFGFGGANAHAILESFEGPDKEKESMDNDMKIFTPFNFSAGSEKSLISNIQSYSNFLKSNTTTSLQSLSWTLNCRRSTLPARLSIVASSVGDLITKLDEEAQNSSNIKQAGQTATVRKPKILGIFTGQGAQWAKMGAELVGSSKLARSCIERLDTSLQTLPAENRPPWLLIDELLKDSSSSRISEALFSQTICTAIQIMLVDLLETACVTMTAVVGHSSGEIAAAYAAGYISSEDAIRIAYYRGWSLQHAGSEDGAAGAMMAVGTSFKDAKELCTFESLEGRICVAASNSPTSVTLSGDIDAIEEAKYVFEDEKKFVRLLKVDRAYHSHHMLPCVNPYIEATRRCEIKVLCPSENRPKWISSVYVKDFREVEESLTGPYWSNNMVSPVLFSDALRLATETFGPFDMAIEVGPHPALKGPALESMLDQNGRELPYSGTLTRGSDSREAFASALGAIWVFIGENAVDFSKFQKAILDREQITPPKILKGLPTYSWDHDRTYWHESRMSHEIRNGQINHFHALLGTKTPDSTPKEQRWRNFLYPREISWLKHHQVQGQIVFPAAGYISAVVELIAEEYGLDSIQLIDLYDIIVGQALVLEETSGTEVLFSLHIAEASPTIVKASFNCYSASKKGGVSMSLHASAQVRILLGVPRHDVLPPRTNHQEPHLAVEADRFYDAVSNLGFSYTGPFRILSDLRRKMDEATGKISVPALAEAEKPLLIHPASLDGALQAIMLAYSFPGDGRMRNLYLPTKIDQIRINPVTCKELAAPGAYLPFKASITITGFSNLSGDVDIYSSDGANTAVQLQGLHTTPLTPMSSETDVPMFSEITWTPENPTKPQHSCLSFEYPIDYALSLDLERISHFHLRRLHRIFSNSENSDIAQHHRYFLDYADHCVSEVDSGKHPFAKSEWANDTLMDILPIVERHTESFEMGMISKIGKSLPDVIRGDVNLLDVLTKDDLFVRFHRETFGIGPYLKELGRITRLISNRYPHINILEIGTGTGEATRLILGEIGSAFTSYTCSDFMSAHLEKLQESLQGYNSRLSFQVLDIEKDITDQGFREESYDLVVASMSLYATQCLEKTLTNVRRLIKPGGYLLILEPTTSSVMRLGLILGGLQAWSMGHSEGCNLSPFISTDRWAELLQKSGFSNIESCMPHSNELPVPFSVMVTQAIDKRVEFLRNPLTLTHKPLGLHSLTIIGGKSSLTTSLVFAIKKLVGRHYKNVKLYSSLSDIIVDDLPVMGTVLSLTELDEPLFPSLTTESLPPFQALFKQSKNILWLAYGAQGSNPFGKMFLGVQRTLVIEMPHLRQQFLNFESIDEVQGELIAERLLIFEATEIWEQDNHSTPFLWTSEPELSFEGGKMVIPRIKLNDSRNDRYNSSKRLIIRDSTRESSSISIQISQNQYKVLEEPSSSSSVFSERAQIDVLSSLLRAVKITETDYLFLIAGKDLQTGHFMVALSEQLSSRVYTPRPWAIKCGESKEDAIRFMLQMYNYLLAQSFVSQTLPGTKIAVLDPDFSLAAILQELSQQKGVQLALVSTMEQSRSSPWICVHPNSTQRDIQRKIPKNITRILNAGNQDDIASLVLANSPDECLIETETTLTVRNSQHSHVLSRIDQVALHFQLAWNRLHLSSNPVNTHRLPTFGLSDLIDKKSYTHDQSHLSWDEERLPVQILPASKKVRFSEDKTYWLLGLTRGLGLTLCKWMARQGAKYIALSSRNPQIDQKWLEMMAENGCTVRVFTNDITDRESVNQTYRKIVETMPSVAGVAQGAMVLQDATFIDLDISRVENVLRPKVEGSIVLDELFSEDTLDFMIFFSSMAAITGSPGQVSYNAANIFMTSLAEQRQKRGLSSQAINIGAVVGNGYVTRELNLDQQVKLYEVGHTWMSEQDFQEIFAEGVISCLEEKGTSEICSSIRIDDDDTKDWILNPVFQHLVLKSDTLLAADQKSKVGMMIKARLLEATSHQDVMDVLKGSFTMKLQSVLDTDPSKPILELSPDELGVDSLIAVDLRSWFLKELAIDMPMLKIFGATSIVELLESAIDLIPSHVVHKMSKSSKVGDDSSEAIGHISSPSVATSEVETDESALNLEIDEKAKSFHLEYSQALVDSGSSVESLGTNESYNSSSASTSDTAAEQDLDILGHHMTQKTIPMSFAQARFWFMHLLAKDPAAFNLVATWELSGELNIENFSSAVETIGQRHESLKTVFFMDDARKPMQGILKKSPLKLERLLIDNEDEALVAARQMRGHVFNIAQGDTVRIQLLSLSPTKHWMIVGAHHVNIDGMSFQALLPQLEQAYRGIPFMHVPIQYPDYTLKQIRENEENQWKDSLDYFRSKLEDPPQPIPLLKFSKRSARPTVPKFDSHIARIRLEPTITQNVDTFCRSLKVTPNHFHLALWQILLLSMLEIDDICIGVADSNRGDADLKQSIGLFLNSVPLRFRRQEGQSFIQVLKDTKLEAQGSFSHSHVPFDVILSNLSAARSLAQDSLFQAFFNYRSHLEEPRKFCGCTSKASLLTAGNVSYDLSLDVGILNSGETEVNLYVQKDIYEHDHAEILLRSYCNIIRAFLQDPETQVNKTPLYSIDDIDEGLILGRGPEEEMPGPETVLHRIDDISQRYPDHIALKDSDGNELSFLGLQTRAAQISQELLKRKIHPGCRVGVFQTPGLRWICSMIAIWRVGASYVPLDRRVGVDRLALMVSKTSPVLILADCQTSPDLQNLHTTVECVDVATVVSADVPTPPTMASAATEAAVLHTSGTTGTPKAISVPHSAYMNFVEGVSDIWNIQEAKEVILQQSSYSWDISLMQILVCLCNAGRLVIANATTRGDPNAISELIRSERVTVTCATPTEYSAWIHQNRQVLRESSLKIAVSAGEALSIGMMKEFQMLGKSELRLLNAYGPVEAAIACSSAEVPYMKINETHGNDEFSVYTLPNYSVHIVDEHLNPLPLGVPGEVLIGGAGISNGYLDEDETAKQFLPNQHASCFFKSCGWTRLYRTGDRGRLTRDGGLVLLGRINGDHQIKLGGIRMNVEEIEAIILKELQGMVSQVVVSLRESTNTDGIDSAKYLVAFVVLAHSLRARNQFPIVERLSRDLVMPIHMRPAAIIPIDSIPQSSTGKIDRHAINQLPLPIQPIQKPIDTSLSPLEDSLCQMWHEVIPQEVMNQYAVHSESDFFHVGGSSLTLMTLQALIKEHLRISVPLYRLFEASKLRDMAYHIDTLSSNNSEVHVDWEEEIEGLLASSSAEPIEENMTLPPYGTKKTVVLTGATGLIGKELLQNLADDERVQTVHCIAVRKSLSQLPPLFSSPKVHIYQGDLGLPQLGLSDKDASAIFSHADIVIHNGADVSFMKLYQSLRMTNVASTKELVKLSLPRRIPFHFISSASVTRFAQQEEFGETSLSGFPPSSNDSQDGYTTAKWVCEVYLEQVSQRFGLPVCIHRPSSVTGPGTPELDLMGNTITYSKRLSKLPDSSSWTGVLDMIPVQSVAAQISQAIHESRSSDAKDQHIRFPYESGDVQIDLRDLQSALESEIGREVDVVPVHEWTDLAEKAGMSPLLGVYLRKASQGHILMPRKERTSDAHPG